MAAGGPLRLDATVEDAEERNAAKWTTHRPNLIYIVTNHIHTEELDNGFERRICLAGPACAAPMHGAAE